jgi:elongator complex protein 1
MEDRISDLEFMMDNEVLVVGTRSGHLLSVLVSSRSVEVVGNVQGGIIQMSASPDGELLAISTGLGMLLLMTPEWDVLYEIPLARNEVI